MNLFDLIFILAFIALIVTLAVLASQLIRGRWSRAAHTVGRLGIAVVAYLATVVVVSIASPRIIVNVSTPQCFDDWCITVASVERNATGNGQRLQLALTLSSRAAGITQAERDVRVFVTDDDGHRYLPIDDAAAIPLSTGIPPMGAISTRRTFLLPSTARHPQLVVAHEWFPHCCIIGDRDSLLHRTTVVSLD